MHNKKCICISRGIVKFSHGWTVRKVRLNPVIITRNKNTIKTLAEKFWSQIKLWKIIQLKIATLTTGWNDIPLKICFSNNKFAFQVF